MFRVHVGVQRGKFKKDSCPRCDRLRSKHCSDVVRVQTDLAFEALKGNISFNARLFACLVTWWAAFELDIYTVYIGKEREPEKKVKHDNWFPLNDCFRAFSYSCGT